MHAGSQATEEVRQSLFTKLEQFVAELKRVGIPCDLWIDGSFLTEADDPYDIDIAVKVMDDALQCMSEEQEAFLDVVGRDDCAYMQGLDTFVFTGYWIGHPIYQTDADDGYSINLKSWGGQFGKGAYDDWLKGIVVVPVMETELGLRIRT